jgi:WD40 repeat protein
VNFANGLSAERHTDCNEAHKYPLIGGRPTWFAFRPDGKGLVTLSGGGDVVLWDVGLEKPNVLHQLKGEDWERAAFFNDGTQLVVVGRTAGVAVLDMPSEKVVFRLPRPKGDDAAWRAAVSPDGSYLATAGQGSGETLIWRLPREQRKSGQR